MCTFYKLSWKIINRDEKFHKNMLLSGSSKDIWHQVSQSDLTKLKETLLWLVKQNQDFSTKHNHLEKKKTALICFSYIFTSTVVILQFYPRTIIIFIVIDINKWLFITLSSDVSPLKVRIPSRVYWLLQWHLASAGANWVLVIFRDFALNFEIPC